MSSRVLLLLLVSVIEPQGSIPAPSAPHVPLSRERDQNIIAARYLMCKDGVLHAIIFQLFVPSLHGPLDRLHAMGRLYTEPVGLQQPIEGTRRREDELADLKVVEELDKPWVVPDGGHTESLYYKGQIEPVQTKSVRVRRGAYKSIARAHACHTMSGLPGDLGSPPGASIPGIDAKELAGLLDVSVACVHAWGRDGKVCREKGSDRANAKWMYLVLDRCGRGTSLQDLRDMAAATKGPFGVIYARVSSHSEHRLLREQVRVLKSKYPDHKVYSDTGSGLDHNRTQFDRMLQLCLNGEVKEICVTTSDRLCFMSYDLVSSLLRRIGVQVRVEQKGSSFTEPELRDDMMAVTDRINRYFHSTKAASKRESGHGNTKKSVGETNP